MPIIPRYNLTQTSTHLTIEVSIPHVRVSISTLDLVIVDGTELHLYAPPTYLLKLNLPDRVVGEDAVEESLSSSLCHSFVDKSNDDGVVRLVVETGGDTNCIVVDDDDDDDEEEDGGCTAGCTKSTSGTSTRLWTKDDLPVLQYNPEKNHGTLVLILRKEEEGYWEDLDLLGRLQQPTTHRRPQQQPATTATERDVPSTTWTATNSPLVKVISEHDNEEVEDDDKKTSNEVMADLLYINKRATYGLFRQFSNVFRDYAREGLIHDMLECPNPDDDVYDESSDDCETHDHSEQHRRSRRAMRMQMENDKFNSERYLSDLHVEEEGDVIFDAAMSMVPHWMEKSLDEEAPTTRNISNESIVDDMTRCISKLSTSDDNDLRNQCSFFDAEESHLLATLAPSRSNCRPMHLSAEKERSAYLCLVDVLFAYAFDHRTTEGDPTVESSWTIMILSVSLSWLEIFDPPYDTIADVLRWNIRRSLIYPYLRSHALSLKICTDLCRIISRGRRVIIRCLLQLHSIMEMSESHYLFNKLYIDPLISWVQECNESEVRDFGREIEALLVNETNEYDDEGVDDDSDDESDDD
ncbi:hypothetical protein ACHAXA_010685 [Cyclostephanos tholiformis]|uniref:CS domain-containing protein n=1 Tax=Cyclostephanos tholiformis TaxID=382380 RepID=A0ABD3SED7_9STRA